MTSFPDHPSRVWQTAASVGDGAFRAGGPVAVQTAWANELASVRYIVDDVRAALDFYTTHLGFTELTDQSPAFADVVRGSLRLLLSGPASSAGRTLPDGRRPVAGGWNRIHLGIDDICSEVDRLTAAGIVFRSELVTGPGGTQVVLDDPSGNPIELFQPAAPRAS